ncbi:MAG: methyltransferase domain-containing protein [Rhodoferax sp.]
MVDLASYLDGSAFSADLAYSPQIIYRQQARSDFLVACARGRRVLHLGFADHLPLIAQRVRDGSWLHMQIAQAAQTCWGVDVNGAAVAAAQGLGFGGIYALDIFDEAAAAQMAGWDVDLVLVPDVIEHLACAPALLRRLAQLFAQAEMVLSVPNALSLRNAVHALRGVERINTDHRVWYSPYTLQKTARDGGLQVDELSACALSAAGSVAGHLLRWACRARPLWADCLVVRARVMR